MKATIIGLGLIGGSLALDLKKRGFASRITGVEINRENGETALRRELVDELVSPEEGVKKGDLIIVAVPADAAINLLPAILSDSEGKTVVDMCSVKERIAIRLKDHINRREYVASHPMAGTEFSGPEAAFSGLFDGKTTIICDKNLSGKESLDVVKRMYSVLKMKIIYMDSSDHDIHAAFVSHISHISSFVLALTVLEKEKDEKRIFEMASGGFESTVRLAKSSAEMWVPVFDQNRENIRVVLRTYINKLNEFERLITEGQSDGLLSAIREANKIREILKDKLNITRL
ncbi:MAG: prephenate dehydrogenase [Bacteroidales bacterium]|nr:prephenate dehydrogenase [Bacteroidales bacterium]MDD3989048.1 prephenate dehydrogenase [Bacteroidales bacterium]MDD4638139.1 prephenate dehydrogenase [Bacteroidales bacterium]